MRYAVLLAVLGMSSVAVAGLALSGGPAAGVQETTTVEVGDYYFCDPSYVNGVCETTVNDGETVAWQWVGSEVHTTTECAGDLDACPEPHLWDTELMDSGSFSFAFDTPGTYLYRCQAHPIEMRGQITVLAAAQPTPTPQASPQASPLGATPTPAAQPSAVPAGGGAPPPEGGQTPLWPAVAAGGLLIASAAVALRRLRR